MYAMLLAATEGCFDKVPVDKIKNAEANLLRELKHDFPKIVEKVNTGDEPDDKMKKTITDLATKIAASYHHEEEKQGKQ